MSINDPQWGNSHRPEQKEPEQVPEVAGTEPVQPKNGSQDSETPKGLAQGPKQPPPSPPPEGPPDLEELWQKLVYNTRCRIARVFGKTLPKPPEAIRTSVVTAPASEGVSLTGWQALSVKSWLIGVSLIIGAWLVSGFYLVDTQQRGVLSRFGQVVSTEDPGWHWRWPYPIDSVRLINVTADRTLEVGLAAQQGRRQAQGLMQTSDGNLVGVSYAVVYQVADPVAYVSHADAPADLLALQAEDVLRDMVARQTLTAMLAAGNQKTLSINKSIGQTARDRLQAGLDPLQIGVVVKGVEIRDVQLPPAVLQSIKETERDEQARVKSLRDTQASAVDRLIKARKLTSKLQDESAAYTQTLETAAQSVREAAATGVDKTQAQKDLADNLALWRQQYPLLFASPTELQGRIQPVVATSPTVTSNNKTDANASSPDAWRDRDIMRSRDRVGRPGGGL